MKQWIGLGLVLSTFAVQAADTTANVSAMQSVVFAGTTGVPVAMQAAISQQLLQANWQVRGAKQLADAKCGVVPFKTDVLDLNGDGQPEVMMLLGNECTSGKIGQTVYLFTQEADQRVQRHLGFSASGYQVLKPKTAGTWSDILFFGTADCQPVWRYKTDKGRYGFNHLYEAKPGACSAPQMGKHGGK